MKSGFSNLIGRPNVGKSSILNRLIGQKLAIVTNKPQTTRIPMKFIYTDDRMQVVFFDNPGYQKPKNKLGKWMNEEIFMNMKDADVNLYVVDNSLETGRLDNEVFNLAREDNTKKALLVNKCDELNGDEIVALRQKYLDMDLFDDVIFISAIRGDGFDKLLDFVYDSLFEGPQYYSEEDITDVSVREIMKEILREKCLLNLDEEIPHGIYVEIDNYEESEDKINVRFILYIERESHKGIVIGKNGTMITKIIKEAERDMTDFCEKKVKIKIDIKIRKNWRKEDRIVGRWF